MKTSFPAVFAVLMQAAWRRRYLIVLPILVMIPIGVLAARYLPQAFVARSLVLLQENGKDNPFTKADANPAVIMAGAQDRLAGLRALLFSDAVLSRVAYDFGARDDRDRAQIVLALHQSLKLDLFGGDFLEFKLSGTRPDGLGRKLEAIMTRFLEALMPDGGGISARQLLLERRRQDLVALQASRDATASELNRLLPEGPGKARSELLEVQGKIKETKREAKRVDDELSRLSDEFGVAPRRRLERVLDKISMLFGFASLSGLEQEIGDVERDLAKGVAVPPARAQALPGLKAALTKGTELIDEIANLKRRAAELTKAMGEYDAVAARLAPADRDIALSKNILAGMSQGGMETARPSRTLGVLRSPELMRVIDPPTDPELPVISRAAYVLSAIAAGILLGLSLAFLAEIFDPTVRSVEEIVAIVGAPVVAHLPHPE